MTIKNSKSRNYTYSRTIKSAGRRYTSNGVSRLGLGLETCLESRCRALSLETLHRLFYVNFCKKEFLKKTVLKMIVQNLAVQRGQRISCLGLLLCCLRDRENNLPSTPFKIYTEFNEKCACTKETPAHNLCNDRLGVLC